MKCFLCRHDLYNSLTVSIKNSTKFKRNICVFHQSISKKASRSEKQFVMSYHVCNNMVSNYLL